jgi:hypothetical protein
MSESKGSKNRFNANQDIRSKLSLRADQNPVQEKQYRAKEPQLPIESFNFVYVDKRTGGGENI